MNSEYPGPRMGNMPGVTQLFTLLVVVGLFVGIFVVGLAYVALLAYQWANGTWRPNFARPAYPSEGLDSERTRPISAVRR